MDHRQRRAFDWLGLGPSWIAREERAALPTGEDGDAHDAFHAADAGDAADMAQATAAIDTLAAAAAGAAPGPDDGSEAMAGFDDVVTADDVDTADGFDAAVGVSARGGDGWTVLQAEVRVCTACELARSRRQTVFGVGSRTADCMIIGEAPGAEEDARGEPFVGQAGRLLDQMLAAIDLSRERDVFICNVLKCRPPGNRNPTPTEVASCAGFLRRQIDEVQPKVLLLLGAFAVRSILETDASVGSQRGRVHRRRFGDREIPIVVSYHPAYLLRNLPEKRKSWEDLLLLADQLSAPGEGDAT